MGLNTSDSRSLREMGLLIVGFYWLLYTPFAGIYCRERQRESYSWCSQRWDKRAMCLGRLHISAVSGVALELQWSGTAGAPVGRERQKMIDRWDDAVQYDISNAVIVIAMDHIKTSGCSFQLGCLLF